MKTPALCKGLRFNDHFFKMKQRFETVFFARKRCFNLIIKKKRLKPLHRASVLMIILQNHQMIIKSFSDRQNFCDRQ